jgi:hypothetical protein
LLPVAPVLPVMKANTDSMVIPQQLPISMPA